VQKSFEKKPKKEPKAKKSVSIGGNVVISPYALNQETAVGKTPQAGDYQPPSVFMKEMEKPDPKKAAQAASSGVLADLWKL
jgi:hypothetical protein